MKRLLTICILCLLIVSQLSSVSVSAAAGLSVSASAATVTEGKTVTITLTYDGGGQAIGGIQGTLTYDTKLFTYVSCGNSNVDTNVPSGIVRFLYEVTDDVGPKSVKIPFTFKATKAGECAFRVATSEFVDDTDDYNPLDASDQSITVSAMAPTATNAPTKSGNAKLKRLVPSKGTLTPKFDPDVTDYTVTVPYDVQSVLFSADSQDPDADVYISGKGAVSVGKNTRVLTVTAPNGTTKKYNLTIIRKEAPSTTTGDTNSTTGTTLPLPPADALDVTIDGKPMTILDTQTNKDLPDGFRWDNLTINYLDVPAAVNDTTGMTLLYLVGENGEGDGFYIYDAEKDTFTLFRLFDVAGGSYLLYDLPTDKKLNNLVWGTLEYESGSVSAYVYHDPALSDFYVVWAAPVEGEARWYSYDKAEGTFQRYYSATILSNTDTTTQKPDVAVDGKVEKEEKSGIAAFFADNQKILLIGGIAIAGVVVIVLLFVMLSSLSGRNKGKH